jgi:fructokinase
MMIEPHLVLGIGELLWDVLPDGRRLGGAPANFAVMAGRLGNRAAILSSIGRDNFGSDAIHRLDPMPVETGFLQTDPVHDTGRVTVSISAGEPHYTIHQPAAWDFLELSDEWVQLVGRANAICFGSLAQRNQESRQTIQTLVAGSADTCIRVFDVNLRAPYYSSEVLQESLELATVAKLNGGEMRQMMELLDLQIDEESVNSPSSPGVDGGRLGTGFLGWAAGRLLTEFAGLQMVAVTRGDHGSVLITRDEMDEHPGFPVKLIDAIGAGDAFTAAMTHYLLRGASLSIMNDAGNRWGAWIASQPGAMPALPDTVRDEIASAIESTL